MTLETNMDLIDIVANAEAAREEYVQVLEDSYWKLIRELVEAFHIEYAALNVATDEHPGFKWEESEEWLYQFHRAQEAAHCVLRVIPMRREMGMPIFHSIIRDLVSLYAFSTMLTNVPPATEIQHLKELQDYRMMDGTGEPVPFDVNDLDDDHLEFMLMGEQPPVCDRIIWGTNAP